MTEAGPHGPVQNGLSSVKLHQWNWHALLQLAAHPTIIAAQKMACVGIFLIHNLQDLRLADFNNSKVHLAGDLLEGFGVGLLDDGRDEAAVSRHRNRDIHAIRRLDPASLRIPHRVRLRHLLQGERSGSHNEVIH